jgi:hypothetical protein
MPSVIERAAAALEKCDGIRFDATHDAISVPRATPDGFDVALRIAGERRFEVRCDGWKETFTRAEDAYDCFAFALSDRCRLKITYRGARAVAWQIEKREYGLWTPGPPIRHRLVPVWRSARVEHRQNHVFHTDSSDASKEQ